MPKQGIVTVELSPSNAHIIVWWLRASRQPQEHSGILAQILHHYRDEHDVEAVAKQFEKVIARRRPGPAFAPITVQISRADSEWFAKHVKHRGGIFGRQTPRSLPDAVRWLCYACLEATTKTRGRKALTRDRLRAAVDRAHLDERHRKRLRRRERQEDAAAQSSAEFAAMISRAVVDATKST